MPHYITVGYQSQEEIPIPDWLEFKRNRPFSYSEKECGSNDISLQFVEFSKVHNCDRSSNAIQSNLANKTVSKYRTIQALL